MGAENSFDHARTNIVQPWKSSKFGIAVCVIAVLAALISATGVVTY